MEDTALTNSHFSKPGFASWLLVVALAMAAYFKFVAALALALILAVVCRPLYDSLRQQLARQGFLMRRPRLAQGLASWMTQGLACLFVGLCVLAPLWVLSRNRAMILSAADGSYAEAREWTRGELQSLGERMQIKAWNDFDELPDPDAAPPAPPAGALPVQSMQDKVVEMVSHPGPDLPFALRTLSGASLLLGQLLFFFMALHFLLLHGPVFWKDVCARCPPAWRPTLVALSRRSRTVLMTTCVVHGLSAASAFLLALPVFWVIVGTKHFVLLAMLAGFFQFIPLLGSVTLVSAVTLYFFAAGNLREAWACLFLAFPLIVGVPDLLIRPYLAGRYGKVHSMTMFAGFITGFEVFGVLGFVLGPLFLDLMVQFTNQVLGTREDGAVEDPAPTS
jgi:predicted PurR-regulated permease PerM